MPVKIRLARRGRRKQPYYHIIVADSRSPRDGKFIEKIGSYNPMVRPAAIELDNEKAFDWLMKGAQPTDTARAILRFKGVMYKKHLQRGVSKGALTQEQADELYQKHVEAKDEKVAKRREQTRLEKLAFYEKVSGSPVKELVEEAPATEELANFQEGGEEPQAEEAEAAATEESAPAEEVAEEATEVQAEEATEEATKAQAEEASTEEAAEAEETTPEATTEAEEPAQESEAEETKEQPEAEKDAAATEAPAESSEDE